MNGFADELRQVEDAGDDDEDAGGVDMVESIGAIIDPFVVHVPFAEAQ